MQTRTNTDVLTELLDLEGRRVIDVGCGDGALARWMTKRGAHVTGVEVSPRMLSQARAAEAAGDEHYMPGLAEDLPVPNRSADVVIYFNSLHHVEVTGLPKAMREAARVLEHGGVLYVSEPMAEGPYFELMKPAHDETAVREAARQVLQHAPEYGFLREKEVLHINPVPVKSFEAFQDRITQINPQTRSRFEEHEAEIRANFDKTGRQTDKGFEFDQPMRVGLYRRG